MYRWKALTAHPLPVFDVGCVLAPAAGHGTISQAFAPLPQFDTPKIEWTARHLAPVYEVAQGPDLTRKVSLSVVLKPLRMELFGEIDSERYRS